jgi:hypothetical protein
MYRQAESVESPGYAATSRMISVWSFVSSEDGSLRVGTIRLRKVS